MSDESLRAEVERLRQLTLKQGRDLEQLSGVLLQLQNHFENEGQPDPSVGGVDQEWKCQKCGALLGVYDPKADLLRVKYKQQVIYVRTGGGGHITSICPRCAETNRLDHEDG